MPPKGYRKNKSAFKSGPEPEPVPAAALPDLTALMSLIADQNTQIATMMQQVTDLKHKMDERPAPAELSDIEEIVRCGLHLEHTRKGFTLHHSVVMTSGVCTLDIYRHVNRHPEPSSHVRLVESAGLRVAVDVSVVTVNEVVQLHEAGFLSG